MFTSLQARSSSLPQLKAKTIARELKFKLDKAFQKDPQFVYSHPNLTNLMQYTMNKVNHQSTPASKTGRRSETPYNGRISVTSTSQRKIGSSLNICGSMHEDNENLKNNTNPISGNGITTKIEEFLTPYTKEFLDIFNNKNMNPNIINQGKIQDDLGTIDGIIESKHARMKIIQKIFRDCLIKKIMIKHEIDEIGEILLKEINQIFEDMGNVIIHLKNAFFKLKE